MPMNVRIASCGGTVRTQGAITLYSQTPRDPDVIVLTRQSSGHPAVLYDLIVNERTNDPLQTAGSCFCKFLRLIRHNAVVTEFCFTETLWQRDH